MQLQVFYATKKCHVQLRFSCIRQVAKDSFYTSVDIAWEYPSKGICVLDLFGGISIGLATMLQAGILVRKYLYVER
jgi:hypothetical protein